MKRKYKVGVIGSFAKGKNSFDGQTVKTCSLADLLKKERGASEVLEIDTFGWKKNPFKLFSGIIKACRSCDNMIILPAQNALRIIPKLAFLAKRKETKLFYSVIGGWLPSILKDNDSLRNILYNFNGIWVETSTMKQALDAQGFNNITIVNNFKKFAQIEVQTTLSKPYKLCIFSRIMRQKGIEDAINAVKEIHEKRGLTYELDIYGMIDNGYKERFSQICTSLPDYIKYCGCVNSSEATSTLNNYFALLFPTCFFTEGIPGTIIDAYSAGVPVISSKWQSYCDVIDEGKTGLGYTFEDYNALVSLLNSIADESSMVDSLRQNCLDKVKEYSEETVGLQLMQLLNNK